MSKTKPKQYSYDTKHIVIPTRVHRALKVKTKKLGMKIQVAAEMAITSWTQEKATGQEEAE